MHMRCLNLENRSIITNIISCYGACLYLQLLPVRWYQLLRDPSTCCHQHIDHVENRLFLHQNGKRVAAPFSV